MLRSCGFVRTSRAKKVHPGLMRLVALYLVCQYRQSPQSKLDALIWQRIQLVTRKYMGVQDLMQCIRSDHTEQGNAVAGQTWSHLVVTSAIPDKKIDACRWHGYTAPKGTTARGARGFNRFDRGMCSWQKAFDPWFPVPSNGANLQKSPANSNQNFHNESGYICILSLKVAWSVLFTP